jgi:NodT family efflux transporter outer membrane factor (OMF) lipoprotein
MALTSLALAALCGCTVGPRYQAPTPDAPADWAALGAAPAAGVSAQPIQDAAWWKSFGDPELTSLVERALAANLAAKQAVLRIEEARNQRRVAAAGAFPTIDATGAYEGTRISERTATSSVFTALSGQKSALPPGVAASIPGLANPFEQFQYGLTGSWEVDLFGRVRRGVEAADADTAAAVADRDAVRVSLMAEVASAYIDLRGAEARKQVSEESVATSTQLLKLTTDARAAGLGNDLDIASARAALATAQAALAPLQTEIAADKSQLELLLAAKPGALDPELSGEGAIPPAPPQTPIGVPSELARRRPDIRAAEAALHAAVARQGVAVANLYPSLTINLAAGLEASNPAALTDWAARYFAAGPALDLPVFDAGVRHANVRIADARAKEAALAYAQTVLTALHEVDDSIVAYGEEQSRRDELRRALADSRAALGLAETRYRTGSVSFRDVLDAEDRLQSAELALAASTTAASEDLVTLYKSLGGGWAAAT